MPHADSAYVPEDIKTKEQFYAHVTEQLIALLDGSRYWVSNLAQTSSLLSNSYLSSPLYGYAEANETSDGSAHSPRVNWVGFYLHPPHHPSSPSSSSSSSSASSSSSSASPLLLGPYVGRPACITIKPIAGKGVCADAFVGSQTVMVRDVEAYPGHIACDGQTRSEIVIPLRVHSTDGSPGLRTIGVLDLDSVAYGTFDEADQRGLERIAELVSEASDWS